MRDLLLHEDDTIAAIATPVGKGGIGIIRTSGPLSRDIFRSVFKPSTPIKDIKSHHLYYGWVTVPETGEIIDEALTVLMKAPKSYTREDVLEIQCHSGSAILRRILELMLSHGARLAEPGEFTKRAFLKGRIDLAQAEAILDLINAQTSIQGQMAIGQLRGNFSFELEKIRSSILSALAQVEAAIDFPEEDIEIMRPEELKNFLSINAANPLKRLLDTHNRGRILRDGARVVLVGRPNVGKSSIFNAFLGTCRVIVSPIPGTTRDTIEESIDLEGLNITLIDTAGLNPDSSNPIENLGINLARREIEKADHILAVFDLSDHLKVGDQYILESLPREKNITIVFNKMDISFFPDQIINAVRVMVEKKDVGVVRVSAQTGEGMEDIKREIIKGLLNNQEMFNENLPGFVPNLRQKGEIEEVIKSITASLEGIEEKRPPEFIAFDLTSALSSMDRILGTQADYGLLDQIFSQFCIGK